VSRRLKKANAVRAGKQVEATRLVFTKAHEPQCPHVRGQTQIPQLIARTTSIAGQKAGVLLLVQLFVCQRSFYWLRCFRLAREADRLVPQSD